MNSSSATGWLEQCSERLREFSYEIEACINKADWSILTSVLASRQIYLEQILSNPCPDEYVKAIRELVEHILEQDAVFESKIQDQKNKIVELQSLLERGRRAVKAYNGQ